MVVWRGIVFTQLPGRSARLGGPSGPLFLHLERRSVSKRTIVYVDGFNLYYGALKGTAHRWLNLQRYFELVRPADDLQLLHYFTAVVDGQKKADQLKYLDALATLPKVRIVLGKYIHKPVVRRVRSCSLTGSRSFMRPEEKRTDVNIGLQMLDDAYQHLTDQMILVSGDSDLVPAIDLVKLRAPNVEVVVYVPNNHPNRGAAVELRGAAHRHRNLPLVELKHARFPAIVPGSGAKAIAKPGNW